MAELTALTRTRKKCPKCNKGTLSGRARRGILVRTLLFWLPIKRYKCNNCSKKTYLYGTSRTFDSPETSLQVEG